jgi:hypothetical protein
MGTELEADLPFFEVDDYLDNYLPSSISAGSSVDLEPVAAGAQRRFARLHAQLGVFTITHKNKQEIEEGKYLAKIVIPSDCKDIIRQQLALLGITQLRACANRDHIMASDLGVRPSDIASTPRG